METNLLASFTFELGVEINGVVVEVLDVDAGVVGGDQPGGMPGRARGKLGFLQQYDINRSLHI